MHHLGAGRVVDPPDCGQGMYPSSARQEVAIVVATDRVRPLFADARDLDTAALEMLEQGPSTTLPRRPGEPSSG